MKKLMLVDDYEDLQLFMKEGLERLGFEVHMASNGKEAFHKMKDEKFLFDVLVTDFEMPEMNGVDLILKAKEEKCLPPKVVIVSSVVEISEQILALRKSHPWIDVLPKPFEKNDFEKILRSKNVSKTV